MANQVLLLGIAGGFAAALVMALFISAATSQSSAQMMNHQGMTMVDSTNISPFSMHGTKFSATGMSMISDVKVTGVTITGNGSLAVNLRYVGTGSAPALTVIAMTNHMSMMSMMQSSGMQGGMSGMGSGMGMMHGGQGNMMRPMIGGAGGSAAWQDSEQWEQWHTNMAQWHGQLNSTQWASIQALHNQMMSQGAMGPGNSFWNNTALMQMGVGNQPALQSGSSTVESGWTSSSLEVRLVGQGSAYESNDLLVVVFPLTS